VGSKLDPHREQIAQLLRDEEGITNTRIRELITEAGYQGAKTSEPCARHERSFARHLTFTDPAHQAELDRLRGNRRRSPDVDVELRPLSRYDALIPACAPPQSSATSSGR
jgi:hypothetical protein